MKNLIIILLLIVPSLLMAQFPNTHGQSNASTNEQFRGAINPLKGLINARYSDTASANAGYISAYPGAQIAVGDDVYLRDSTATKWLLKTGGGVVHGTAITSLPAIGFVPNQTDPANWINEVFYQSQVPTATLTGGINLEYRSAQTMNYTLNWTAGRQSATEPIASIVVDGVAQSFTQPDTSATVSGTQAVSFPANTDITYSNIVTTTDSKTATATTSFVFYPKRYYGWIDISDTAGIGTTGYDDTKITALGNELSASKVKTWNTGSPTGTQIYVYAYYATAGELNNLILNGFPSIDAFNHVTRSFTNALGYTGQWIIYWNKNGQTLSSDIIAN